MAQSYKNVKNLRKKFCEFRPRVLILSGINYHNLGFYICSIFGNVINKKFVSLPISVTSYEK
jgi:hypothetical protein